MPVRFRTIQTRLLGHPALRALAVLNFRVRRDLMIELEKGRAFTGDLAKTFYQKYGISAKNLEHIYIALKGEVDSLRKCTKLNIVQLGEKIKAKSEDIDRRQKQIVQARKIIAKEQRKAAPDIFVLARQHATVAKAKHAIHQHKRRLYNLHQRLTKTEERLANPKLCFGSRELMRKRNNIEADNEHAIAAWRIEWHRRRSGEIFVPGDASMPDGNAFVRLGQSDSVDGWNLILRLPVALKDLADRTIKMGAVQVYEVDLGRITFPHGGDAFAAMLDARKSGIKAPVTWCIQPHERGGWKVSTTFQEVLPDLTVKNLSDGAFGVDFNAQFLKLAHIDGQGNLISTWNVPLVTHSRSTHQNLDTCRKVALEIVKHALDLGIPIVAEHLDFSKKKAAVTSEQGSRYARMLNGLVYASFAAALDSAAARHGVLVKRVNPAFTSIAGHAKYSRRLGLSTHAGAAICIARRAMRFSERIPQLVEVCLGRDVHVTLPRPEVASKATGIAKGDKAKALSPRRHVWSSWRQVCVRRKAALTAHLRSVRKNRSLVSSGASSDALPGAKDVGISGIGGAPKGARGNVSTTLISRMASGHRAMDHDVSLR
jgi:IS605 OrfB family transposase